MRVLIFHAAMSTTAVAQMNRVNDLFRQAGHTASQRFYPAFNGDNEIADKVILAVTEAQARSNFGLAESFMNVFQDRAIVAQLDETDGIEGYDWDALVSYLGPETSGPESRETLLAAAIERGLPVTSETTTEELRAVLDLGHPDTQEQARAEDADKTANGMTEHVAGTKSTADFGSTNRIFLERMDDERLRNFAERRGLRIPNSAKRETIINKVLAGAGDVDLTEEDVAADAEAMTVKDNDDG